MPMFIYNRLCNQERIIQMSKAVKERKANQRKELTIGKLVNGVTLIKQAQAKNDPIEKARQQFQKSQMFVSYGNLYGDIK
jgi:hypothetical protein